MSNILKVAFYKASGNFSDKIIRLVTRSKYSHCELLLPDGRMFSSDGWDNGKVRYTYKYNINNWDFVDIDITDGELLTLISWCNHKIGLKYDWLGVFRFIIPFLKQDPERWFCSEICAAALRFINKINISIKPYKLSPKNLYNILTNK
jgi:hypothetical protein